MKTLDLGPCGIRQTMHLEVGLNFLTFPIIQEPSSVDEDMTPILDNPATCFDFNIV